MPARLPIRIAPAGAVPPRVGEDYTHPTLGSATLTPGVREGDRVVHNGTTFNGRGYRVCGVVNQRGTLCGRIGTCPYRHGQQQEEETQQPQNAASLSTRPPLSNGQPAPAVREQQQLPQQQQPLVPSADSGNAGSTANGHARNNGNRVEGDAPARLAPIAAAAGTCPKSVLHLDAAPAKAGFKRSWSREEHARFLLALRRRGRGKWKEIARDIGTRTANQCQSHAQKHFLRQAKDVSKRMKPSIHDITEVADLDRPPEPHAALTSQATPSLAVVTHKDEESRAAAGFGTGTGVASQERPGPACDNRRHGREAELTAKSVTAVTSLRQDNGHQVARKEGTILVGGKQTDRPRQEDAQLLLENFAIGARATHGSCLQPISNPTAGTERKEPPPPAAGAACGPSEGPDDPWRTVPILIPVSELQNLKQFAEWIQPNAGVISTNDAAFRENSSSALAHVAVQPTQAFAALQMSVRIHRNGTSTAEGLSVTFPESMAFDDFLVMAAKELGVPPNLSRIFTRSGGEISSLDEVIEDDALWLSKGEEFCYPAL
jgi:SHAQKYF class myb-like DNA-binding protein